jgi:hypothetical protein
MTAPGDWYQEYLRQQHEREKYAARLVTYLSPMLRFLGVEEVKITFDGYGDDGQVQDPVFTPAPAGGLPEGLGRMIEEICENLLPGGWEVNSGSFGTILILAGAGIYSVNHTWRDEEEEDYDDEDDIPISEDDWE